MVSVEKTELKGEKSEAAAEWLPSWTLLRKVWVRDLAGVNVLCSWALYSTLPPDQSSCKVSLQPE